MSKKYTWEEYLDLTAEQQMEFQNSFKTFEDFEKHEFEMPFNEISTVTVLGKNKLNIYHGDRLYQIKGDQRFNALKYVNIYYQNKNVLSGDENAKFLGL